MSLHEIWEAAATSPFSPIISKDNQLFVGFALLIIGLVFTGLFGLNRSLTSIPLFGIPASLAFGFGAVYTICGFGVYLVLHRLEPLHLRLVMDEPPVFTALSTSARQLYMLLRCIAFTAKAEVRVLAEGLSFSVDDARVVQGTTLLERRLFSSYIFNPPSDGTIPIFQVSLPALLETLQIFGIGELASSHRNQNGGFYSTYATAFNTPALALGGKCHITYARLGGPLSITISEAGVTTTCDLSTYDSSYYDDDLIPLDKTALVLKLVMRSTWLQDAIAELSGSNPTVLIVNASSTSAPYFALEGKGGPFGDCTVEFQPEGFKSGQTNPRGRRQPEITETFAVNAPRGSHGRLRQRYKFDSIKKAGRAMALANKVSLRQDVQGVLGLQFMVEMGSGANVNPRDDTNGALPGISDSSINSMASFVQFRYVPLMDEEDEEEDEESEERTDNQG